MFLFWFCSSHFGSFCFSWDSRVCLMSRYRYWIISTEKNSEPALLKKEKNNAKEENPRRIPQSILEFKGCTGWSSLLKIKLLTLFSEETPRVLVNRCHAISRVGIRKTSNCQLCLVHWVELHYDWAISVIQGNLLLHRSDHRCFREFSDSHRV